MGKDKQDSFEELRYWQLCISCPAVRGFSADFNRYIYVEAEIYVSTEYQRFCVLECCGCRQKKHTREVREFNCVKCNRMSNLVPRCSFQVDLIDGTGTVTAFVSGDVGERMLDMKADEIFQTTCTENRLLPMDHIVNLLSDKLFRIQLRKLSWGSSYAGQPALKVVSFVEKGGISNAASLEPRMKKAKSVLAIEGDVPMGPLTSGSSSGRLRLNRQPHPRNAEKVVLILRQHVEVFPSFFLTFGCCKQGRVITTWPYSSGVNVVWIGVGSGCCAQQGCGYVCNNFDLSWPQS